MSVPNNEGGIPMKATYTLVSYTFYYKNDAPYFYTFSIGIFDGVNMIHHNCILSYDEYDFIQTLKKAQNENFQPNYGTDLGDGVTTIDYSKSFGAD